MEPCRIETRAMARTLQRFSRIGELVLFRIPLPHTRRTNQNRTISSDDSGWDKGFWCGRLDEDNAHVIITEGDRQMARTIHRLPPNQRTGVSWLKLVKGLPWDGQGGSPWSTSDSDTGNAHDGW